VRVEKMRRLKASIPACKQLFTNYMTFDISMHLLPFGSFKEAFSRPEGPYRSPMPWGPLVAGGKRIYQKLAFLLNRFDKKGRKW